MRNVAIRAFRPREEPPDNPKGFDNARELIPLLDDPATQYNAADVLGRLGKNIATRPLLKLLKAEDKSVRSAAVEALGRLKDKQVAVELTAALRDQDTSVVMRAANSLGQIGDMRTTPDLVKLLSSNESSIRRDAATALGQIGDVRAVPSLILQLGHTDQGVRCAAAGALGQIGDLRAFDPLCKSLVGYEGDDPSIARALGRLRDPRAIGPLTDHILDRKPDARGRRHELAALSLIRHPDTISSLIKIILNTSDGLTAHHAKRVLGDLVGHSFSHEPKEVVMKWWELNRGDYLRPVPGAR